MTETRFNVGMTWYVVRKFLLNVLLYSLVSYDTYDICVDVVNIAVAARGVRPL